MTDDFSASSLAVIAAPMPYPWYHWRRLGFNFLTLSLLAHLLFGVVAAYFVVQTIHAPHKQNFAGGPKSDAGPKRAIEHKVQLQKQRQSMSAPTAKRVTTTGLSKVSLPTMPTMPTDAALTPMSMSGMSGGSGLGLGQGGGGGGAGGGGGGGGLSMFGLRTNTGNNLVGTFFDLKQTPDQRLTPIAKNGPDNRPDPAAMKEYERTISQYVLGGMNDSTLVPHFFKGPNPLYTTQVFIPSMSAAEGPNAFGLRGRVQPSRWLVHYHGAVIPPESGSYRFVGVGDDVLVVRFNNNVVLDCGGYNPSGRPPTRYFAFEGLSPKITSGFWAKGSGEGISFNVEANRTYPIDILISEKPGGYFKAWLMIEKDGVEYKKDARGCPILPLFRLTANKLPPARSEAPQYDPDGPIWKGVTPKEDSSSIH